MAVNEVERVQRSALGIFGVTADARRCTGAGYPGVGLPQPAPSRFTDQSPGRPWGSMGRISAVVESPGPGRRRPTMLHLARYRRSDSTVVVSDRIGGMTASLDYRRPQRVDSGPPRRLEAGIGHKG